MNALTAYVPVAAGWGFRFTCQECGTVGHTRFDADGLVPNVVGWYMPWMGFGLPCPASWGMWLGRYTLRGDNYWPILNEAEFDPYRTTLDHWPTRHEPVEIEEIADCPVSLWSWQKLPAEELTRLFDADPHHFNVVALEGAILGLRRVTPATEEPT